MIGFPIPGTTKHITGAVFRTDPKTGTLICVHPGITTWSSDWPEDAKKRVAHLEGQVAELRRLLARQQMGESDA
jgi:hypothetical protein